MSQTPLVRASTLISDPIIGITASFLIHSAYPQFSSKTWTKLIPNGHNIIALIWGRPYSIQIHRLVALNLDPNSPHGAKVQQELAKCNTKHISSLHHSTAPL
jgi:hypothetical protein